MMTAQGPLAGLKVIELAHIMAGPVCGLMVADMGFLPPGIEGESAAFMMMNRNKRGIAIDLKHPSGKAVLRRLLADADVLIENYRSDTMAKLGLGYEDLRKDNPGLIYCALSGFGRTGPYAELGGFDLIAQGMSGLMSITGEGPGRQPVKSGAPVPDITAGILAAMGVLAAYVHRLRTGEGQMVDTSLFEAGITHTYWQSAIALATGMAPGPMGSAHPLNGPYQAFEASDGWLTVGAGNQTNWQRMLEAMELRELADDPRFVDNAARMKHLDALTALLAARFRQRDTADWLARFAKVGVPAGPVLDIKQMHQDPQTAAREMLVEVAHPKAGKVKTIGLPVKFSATPGKVARAAPLLGEQSRDILAEHGYSATEIDALAAERAVLLGTPER